MPKKSTSTTFPAKNNNISHHYLREAIQKKYGIFCGNFFPKRGGGKGVPIPKIKIDQKVKICVKNKNVP